MKRKILREASSKKDVNLAVLKCLTGAQLTRKEVESLCEVSEADLIKLYGCDHYMVEKVRSHSKQELFRQRAQSLYTRDPSEKTLYPDNPYTRTYPIKESRKRIKEDHHFGDSHESGRMLDYGHQKSDSEEGKMMKQFLRDAAVDAYRLHQMVEDGDDLPQWCQYKISQAQGMIQSVRNYLEYELEREGQDLVGEEEMFDAESFQDDFEPHNSYDVPEHEEEYEVYDGYDDCDSAL